VTVKFPRDAPKEKVLKALQRLSFEIVREGNHIALIRRNKFGAKPPHEAGGIHFFPGLKARVISQD
jgi:hypothetical protein